MTKTKPTGSDADTPADLGAPHLKSALDRDSIHVRVNRRIRVRDGDAAKAPPRPEIPKDRYTDREFNRIVVDHAIDNHDLSEVVLLWRMAAAHGGAISIGRLLAKAGLGHPSFVSAAHLVGQGRLLARSPGRLCLQTVVEANKRRPGRAFQAVATLGCRKRAAGASA